MPVLSPPQDTLLRVDGRELELARAVRRARDGASLRRAVAKLLKDELDPSEPPGWVLFSWDPWWGAIVHLGDPCFGAVAVDEDDYHAGHASPDADEHLLVEAGRRARARRVRFLDGGTRSVRLDRSNLSAVDAFDTGDGVVLTNLRWLDPPPKTAQALVDLLARAGAASLLQIPAYTPTRARAAVDHGAGWSCPLQHAPLGGPEQRSAQATGLPRGEPALLWRLRDGAARTYGHLAPVASKGMIHASGCVVDPSGEKRWDVRSGGKLQHGAVCATEREVYMTSGRGVHALDAVGAERWLRPLNGARQAPVVAGEACLVSTDSGLQAVRRRDGKLLWTQSLPEASGGLLACADGVAYVKAGRRLFAIRLAGPEVLWDVPGGSSPWGPLILDDLVVFGRWHAKKLCVVAVDRDGNERWATRFSKREGLGWTTFAANRDAIVVLSKDGHVHGLCPRTGERRWRYERGRDMPENGSTLVGSTVLLATEREPEEWSLEALDAHTGARRWSVDLEDVYQVWGRPCVADGRIYLHTEDGLVAYG